MESTIILQSFCMCGNACYASALKTNGLFRIMENDKMRFVAMFPNEEINKANLFVDAVAYNGYILFVPGSAENICVYNTEDGSFILLPINKATSVKYNTRSKFSTAICYQDKIFVFPETYPAIIRISCENWEMEYIDEWVPKERFSFKKGIAVINDKVILTSVLSNIFMEFGLVEEDVRLRAIPIKINGSGAWSVCEHNEELFMLIYPGPQIIKCKRSGGVETTVKFPDDFKDNGYAFAMSFIKENNMYACPVYGNMMVCASCENLEIQEVLGIDLAKIGYKLMFLCRLGKYLVFCRYAVNENVMSAEVAENVFLDTETLKVYTAFFTLENKYDYYGAKLSGQAMDERIFPELTPQSLYDYLTYLEEL